MTEPTANLAAALAAFQAELPAITKNKTARVKGKNKQTNLEFDYTYKYADLADVSAVVMPLIGKHGLAFTCQPGVHDGVFGLAYQLLHASGELIDGFYPVDVSNNPQQVGGLITYARRYILCAVTGVAADEDTDAQHTSAPAAGTAGRQSARTRPAREAPPIRPLEELPRNADGSLSRSRCTEAELAHYGNMTDAQQREHNKLERGVLGTDSKGKSEPSTERLPSAPGGEEFYDPPPPLRTPQPAQPARSAIFGHFNRLAGKDGPFTDEQRYGAMSTITGRKITSTNDLTAAEGVEVIRFLQKRKDHDALVEALAIKAGEDVA